MRRVAVMTVGLLAVGVCLAACGGTPAAHGDATGSTATTSPSGGGGTQPTGTQGSGTQGTGLLQYSTCIRSHGVPNFPDPSSSGGVPKQTAQQLGVSDSVLETANSDCQSLIPPGESLSGQATQPVTPQEQQDYLNLTACLHSHGFPTFPEPVFSSSGQVEFPMVQHLVDISSPQFKQAYHTCQKLIPAGLPFSGSGG